MQNYTEIPLAELSLYAVPTRDALQAICESAAFRTSPKSCEFLRHIINRSLSGDTDELKERLIGMSLLGREATYDTGSDAGVRVRANDVRKRLAAYNVATAGLSSFTFDLPSGSYVPRFLTRASLSFKVKEGSVEFPPSEAQAPLTLQQLALPTVIALFLCIVCLRWQIAREHPFTTFWQSVFQGHSATLYLPSAQGDAGHQLLAMNEIQATTPLLNLAGQFNSELNLTSNPYLLRGDTLVAIGPSSQSGIGTWAAHKPADSRATPDPGRLTVVDTANGRIIFDRVTSKTYPTPGGAAALLTISNHPVRLVHIDGTDEASINALIRLLCERGTFPEGLADELSDAATTQVVFPMEPDSQPIFLHESNGLALARTGDIP